MTEAAQVNGTLSPTSSISSAVENGSDGCTTLSENELQRRRLANGNGSANSVASSESSDQAVSLHHVRNMIRQAARRHVECRCKCAIENEQLRKLVATFRNTLHRQKEEMIVLRRNIDEIMEKTLPIRHVQIQTDLGVAKTQTEPLVAATDSKVHCSNDLGTKSEQPTQVDIEVPVTAAKSIDTKLLPSKRQKAVKTLRPQPATAKISSCSQPKPLPVQLTAVPSAGPVVQSQRLTAVPVSISSNGASVSSPTIKHGHGSDQTASLPIASTNIPNCLPLNGSSLMPAGNSEQLNGVSNRFRNIAARPSWSNQAINGLAKEVMVALQPQTATSTLVGSAKRKTDPMTPLHEVPLSKINRRASSPYAPPSLILEADDIITLDDDDDDDHGDALMVLPVTGLQGRSPSVALALSKLTHPRQLPISPPVVDAEQSKLGLAPAKPVLSILSSAISAREERRVRLRWEMSDSGPEYTRVQAFLVYFYLQSLAEMDEQHTWQMGKQLTSASMPMHLTVVLCPEHVVPGETVYFAVVARDVYGRVGGFSDIRSMHFPP